MHWLPISFLFSFGFGQLFKWAQRRGCYAPIVVPTNYLVLATVLLVYYLSRGTLVLTPAILKVGIVTGCTFIVSMRVLTWALEIADVAAGLTAFRLAILVPIGTSVWVWGESVAPRQLAGIVLALVALILMTRGTNHHHRISRAGSAALVFLVFCLQGVSHTCIRWVHYAGLDEQRLLVLMVIGYTAGILGFLDVAIRPRPLRSRDVVMGAGIGLYNLAALGVVLTALSVAPGTVFFPLQGCSVVILDNLFAHFFWKERLSWPARIGAGLGALSMLLVL